MQFRIGRAGLYDVAVFQAVWPWTSWMPDCLRLLESGAFLGLTCSRLRVHDRIRFQAQEDCKSLRLMQGFKSALAEYGKQCLWKKTCFPILGIVWFCIAMNPAVAQTDFVPAAETASILTMTIGLSETAGIEFIANPYATAQAGSATSTVTFATTVRSLQDGLGSMSTAVPGISAHAATAGAGIAVGIAPGAWLGGALDESGMLARFTMSQATYAAAWTDEPLFGRATAMTEGVVLGIQLGADPARGSDDLFLHLDWDFDALRWQGTPASSLAYVRDTLTTVQISATGAVRYDEVGFLGYLENGLPTVRVFDVPGSDAIRDWFATQFNAAAGRLLLQPDAESLRVAVPLLDAFDREFAPLGLILFSSHTEQSYEAPPRAVIQVEESAGYRASGAPGDPQVHWDPSSGLLAFDPIPLDILRGRRDWTFDADELADSLLGGFLEIDPLAHLGTLEGRRYFSGGDLRLFDGDHHLVLTAHTPTVVLDGSLRPAQGFNGFAPILMTEPGGQSDSRWLAEFLSRVSIDSLYLPELFLGFDTGMLEAVDTPVSMPVSALLSFAGPVPPLAEAATLWLLGGGLALLLPWWRRSRNGSVAIC